MKRFRYYLKKILGKPDLFESFQNNIHLETWIKHDQILNSALQCLKDDIEENNIRSFDYNDPVVNEGFKLRKKVLEEFKEKLVRISSIRMLIHIPEKNISPGGHSLFSNLGESLKYIGVPVRILRWQGDNLVEEFKRFKPNVFITSDNDDYLRKIDWSRVIAYKKDFGLHIGLTASLEQYGNTPLPDRLRWSKEHLIDFYYSFRAPEYYNNRPEYMPFFEEGYRILSVEFGANPILYYPVPGIARDLNYVFLASSNPDKWDRYYRYLPELFSEFPGFINGPGWKYVSMSAPAEIHRYLYARARVGINLHIQESIDWANELNERTYILAACGVPQLLDNPKLLNERFSRNCFYVAENEKQYREMFREIINNPIEGNRRALSAIREVFSKHTTFHRAEKFFYDINSLL
jgi:hypothetical protein